MDSKPPVQPIAKPLRRKVHVVYYLSRGGGQMDHPHLLEGYLSAAQDGLRLRDFKRWLSVLRGKSMPNTFAWSYKRSYKNGFIWHDLGDNDTIQPVSKNEYVLMGSEIREQGVVAGKCKCGGGLQQHAEAKVSAAELRDIEGELPLNKTMLRSPKVVTKIHTEDDQNINGATPNGSSSGRLVTLENIAYDNKMISKSGTQSRGGSSSFNELITARRSLLEEVKRPTSYHETTKHSVSKSLNQIRQGGIARALIRDSDLIAAGQSEIVEEPNSNDEVHGGLYEAKRDLTRKGNHSNSSYMKQATPMSRRHYDEDSHQEEMIVGVMSDSHDNDDDVNGSYIMDAATQTGDSTRCSTDHQDGATISAGYNNMLALVVDSPGSSGKYSTEAHGYGNASDTGAMMGRVSSARFNINCHSGPGLSRRNLQLSREFSNFPGHAGEKDMKINQAGTESAEDGKALNVSSSNNTSLHNHMGSPALSTCSAMSARSTRFAREDNLSSKSGAAVKSSSKKHMSKLPDRHHTHQKGSSHSNSTSTASTTPHTLLKQLLTCGNSDVISTESKPSDHVIMNSNALSGVQTPSSVISTPAYQGGLINGHDKKSPNGMWACKPGLMKRVSTPSSDNKSVISATVSDQASIRDTLDMISSPESVCNNRHLRSHIIKANSLTFSASASQLRTAGRKTAAAPGSTSPGMLSVGSSTSRRSSIRESDMNTLGVVNAEDGFREVIRNHHIGVGVSPKTRLNKGNKNTLLIHDILDNEVSHDNRNLARMSNTTKGSISSSTSVRELHKLICNPSGTPPCTSNHNKVISSNFPTTPRDRHNYNATKSYTPKHHQSHHILIATHGPLRTPTSSSNLSSPNLVVLSKSLNSPSTSMFFEEVSQPPPSSSSYISSWKDLLWSPRYNSSDKEKDKRCMKP